MTSKRCISRKIELSGSSRTGSSPETVHIDPPEVLSGRDFLRTLNILCFAG